MNLIAAVDKNWGIGKGGKLLCSIPGDLKFFKEKTSGKVIIMGRSTLESLPGGKPLKNRVNIVLTNKRDYAVNGALVIHSIDALVEMLVQYPTQDVFVIGGGSVYNELMPLCDTLYITKIDHEFDADTFITNADKLDNFKVINQSETMEENGYKYNFVEYRRKRITK